MQSATEYEHPRHECCHRDAGHQRNNDGEKTRDDHQHAQHDRPRRRLVHIGRHRVCHPQAPFLRSLPLCDAIVTGFEIPAWSTPTERVEPSKRHHYARKLTNSVFTRSACVHRTPCGPPGSSTNLTFLIIFACLRDVASGGRMRSASPCRMSVGTVFFGMSLRKSSIQQSTHASVPAADAPTPTFQLSSSTRSLTSFPPVTS